MRLRFFYLCLLMISLAAPAQAQSISSLFNNSNEVDASLQARIDMRQSALEQNITKINGKIEELSYQLAKLQSQLDKMNRDYDFRLQTLEKNQSAAAAATSASTSAVPVSPIGSSVLPTVENQKNVMTPPPPVVAASVEKAPAPKPAPKKEAVKEAPKDAASDDAKPADSDAPKDAKGKVYKFNGAKRDATDEAYDEALEMLHNQKYEDAEKAFRKIVKDNPKHPTAGNAQFYVAETFFQRKDYETAAIEYGTVYEVYPKAEKAPEALLKLAKSMFELNHPKDSCDADKELTKKYKDAPKAILAEAKSDMTAHGCK